MGGVWRVVQSGQGQVRPLVVCYYIGGHNDQKIRDVISPVAAVLNLTTQPGDGSYPSINSLNLPIRQLRADWGSEWSCTFSPVVLMGWSAGCQALRAQLIKAQSDQMIESMPDAIVALDGIHSSEPPQPYQIDTWRRWMVEQCGAELGETGLGKAELPHAGIMVATCSQIEPPSYRSVRATLEQITGWSLPPGQPPGDDIPWPGVPGFYPSGNVQVWSWPGKDAAAHAWQQNFLAPFHLYDVAARLGFGGSAPAPPPGVDGVGPIDLTIGGSSGISVGRRLAMAAVPAAIGTAIAAWSIG